MSLEVNNCHFFFSSNTEGNSEHTESRLYSIPVSFWLCVEHQKRPTFIWSCAQYQATFLSLSLENWFPKGGRWHITKKKSLELCMCWVRELCFLQTHTHIYICIQYTTVEVVGGDGKVRRRLATTFFGGRSCLNGSSFGNGVELSSYKNLIHARVHTFIYYLFFERIFFFLFHLVAFAPSPSHDPWWPSRLITDDLSSPHFFLFFFTHFVCRSGYARVWKINNASKWSSSREGGELL